MRRWLPLLALLVMGRPSIADEPKMSPKEKDRLAVAQKKLSAAYEVAIEEITKKLDADRLRVYHANAPTGPLQLTLDALVK